jgi:hypothetical protein
MGCIASGGETYVPLHSVTLPPGALACPAVASDPPGDLLLSPIDGDARSLDQWLTTFHLACVVIDPYTNESAWILETASRIMDDFRESAVRVSWMVCGSAEDATAFLGPLADRFLTFADPDRTFVKALGLTRLPAFVFVQIDGTVQAVAEGWHPAEWRKVSDKIAATTSWSRSVIPEPQDPPPFDGSAAAG